MTPSALQTILPGAANAANAAGDRTRRTAPADEAASFASALDASVQALADGGQPDAGDRAEPAEPQPAVSEQPQVDALALMLATAPVLPAPATPVPGSAFFGAAPQIASDALALVAASAGATSSARALPADALQADALRKVAATPDDAAHKPLLPGAAGEPRSAQATPAMLQPQAGAHRTNLPVLGTAAGPAADAAADGPALDTLRGSAATVTGADPMRAPAAGGRGTGQGTPPTMAAAASPPSARPTVLASAAPAAPAVDSLAGTQELQASPAGRGAEPAATAGEAAAAPLPAAANSAGAAGAVTPASSHTAPAAVAHLSPAVGSAEWAPALAQQIVRLPRGEVELQLNPAELGPLRVRLSFADSQAQLTFVAEHATVRHALEAALPQLRTSLAENGISLGQATVGSGAGEHRAGGSSGERQGGNGERRDSGGQPAAPGEPTLAGPPAAPWRRAAAGGLDTFA